ncbi:hypothetical protein Adt_36215 [Abeliophyllum distichum]|uniref:Uncharacterized protein n=1 Tax=Abeliophyllum distichum TaxID=126358 RepID=A0ABD1QKJ1_9LAMI
MPSGSARIRRQKVRRQNLSRFLHLLRFYTKNPNHDLMEHLDAIEEIHRRASLYGHELCREEAVFHLFITLYGYWRGHEQVPKVDSEGHIIEYVPGDPEEEEDPKEDEDTEQNESAGENY